MSAEAGLVAILALFPVYLLYTNKFSIYAGFAKAATS
jgi:hypothetical protein